MSDNEALLAAIAAQPDEDTPRLAFADWLEEHGQPIRAEFIRLQCDIAKKESLSRAMLNQHVDLFKRQQELIDHHRAELLGPLAALPETLKVEFRRGFVSEIELPVGGFLPFAETIASTKPRPRVSVTQVVERLYEFIRCPQLGCVTRIAVYSSARFTNPPPPPDNDVILDSLNAKFTSLESLDLEGCGINDQDFDLIYNYHLPALVDLDLSNNTISDVGVVDLLRTSLPAQLKRLILGGNPIGDQGAIELADRWPKQHRLEELNLRFTNIGQPGHQALLARFGGIVRLF
jgi:uncharacterized protein (TIGR02996 family)